MNPTLLSTNVSTHVTCSSIVTTSLAPTLVATVDPSYVDYRICQCSVGYFEVRPRAAGAPPTCLPCNDAADDSSMQCTCENGLLRGCYPTPFDGTWASSLPCPVVGLNETACNPASVVPAANTSTSAFTVSDVFQCAPGYTNRLCSRCIDGYGVSQSYYRSSRECAPCRAYAYTLPII